MKQLKTHPRTGKPITPLGYRKDGRPIWPIMGGSGEGEGGDGDSGDGEGGEGEGAGDGEGEGTGDLGDAGKKALKAERERANAAEKRNKQLEAENARLRGGKNDDGTGDGAPNDKAIEAAREEGRQEAAAAANRAVIAAETRALAATAKMRDPRDAVIQLSTELKDVQVDENGAIDSASIEQLLKDLKAKKPYLFDNGTSTVSHTDAGIGTGGDSGTPDPGPGRNRLAAAYGAKS